MKKPGLGGVSLLTLDIQLFGLISSLALDWFNEKLIGSIGLIG